VLDCPDCQKKKAPLASHHLAHSPHRVRSVLSGYELAAPINPPYSASSGRIHPASESSSTLQMNTTRSADTLLEDLMCMDPRGLSRVLWRGYVRFHTDMSIVCSDCQTSITLRCRRFWTARARSSLAAPQTDPDTLKGLAPLRPKPLRSFSTHAESLGLPRRDKR